MVRHYYGYGYGFGYGYVYGYRTLVAVVLNALMHLWLFLSRITIFWTPAKHLPNPATGPTCHSFGRLRNIYP